MYRTINDFLDDWKYESESTLKLFKNLTRESLEQKVEPNGRSLRTLAWHITMSNPEMLVHAGMKVDDFDESKPAPENPVDIINEYDRTSRLVEKSIMENWDDAQLTDEIDIYNDKWKKGKVLASLITHQTHHRAQMTVLMRQAGLKVPGIYGPSKEEWEIYGMQPQK